MGGFISLTRRVLYFAMSWNLVICYSTIDYPSTWASPLASDSNVWFFGQNGETTRNAGGRSGGYHWQIKH